MEEEPVLYLSLADGRELEGTRNNTTLYRFFGKLACYDHIFHVTDFEKGMGVYIFSINPIFDDLAANMVANNYPAHLNMPEVAECDLNAFDKTIHNEAAAELEAGIPEDWC